MINSGQVIKLCIATLTSNLISFKAVMITDDVTYHCNLINITTLTLDKMSTNDIQIKVIDMFLFIHLQVIMLMQHS